METTAYIALSRQGVLRREMDVIANNLANVNTPGFKGESMLFIEHLEETQRARNGSGTLSLVRDIAQVRNLAEGPLAKTQNPLDLAIHGEGYFVIETPEGQRFTRVGNFTLDAENQLVTAQGHPVLDAGDQPIVFPLDTEVIEVLEDGTVATEEEEILAQLRIVTFENEQELMKRPDGLYEAGENIQPQPVEDVRIAQGMLEQSNVEPIIEMARMIEVSRSYQSVASFQEKEHERVRRAIQSLVSET